MMLRGHTTMIGSAAWSPDGKRFVTAALDGVATVWDASTGQPVFTLHGGSKGYLVSVDWSRSTNLIAMTSNGGRP